MSEHEERRKSFGQRLSEGLSELLLQSNSTSMEDEIDLDITNDSLAEKIEEEDLEEKDCVQHDWRPYKKVYMRCLHCESLREANDKEKKLNKKLSHK
jgi:hypothetical protein